MKTVKSRLFKKYYDRRKSQARFCLSLGWLHISEKKSLKTPILLLQEHRIWKKESLFGPTLILISPIFGEFKKGKLYILKKVGIPANTDVFKTSSGCLGIITTS